MITIIKSKNEYWQVYGEMSSRDELVGVEIKWPVSTESPQDMAISLLDIHPKELKSCNQKNFCNLYSQYTKGRDSLNILYGRMDK